MLVTTYNTTLFLYGHETSSLTLKEKYKIGVFEDRVLKGVFGPTRK
jgi:hypothetical protein